MPEMKTGDVTVEYRFDVKLVKSLLNLEDGKIVPDEEAIARKGLIGEFLCDFIHLPDILLYYDRLVLPRSKAFYADRIGDKFSHSRVIEKLEKSKVLYFPSQEAYDIERAREKHRDLIALASREPRVRCVALVMAPDNPLNSEWLKGHGFLAKDKAFKRYWAGGADDIVQWANTINLPRMYGSIPDNISNDPILSRRRVEGSPGYAVSLTSNIPVVESGYYSSDFMFFDKVAREAIAEGCKFVLREIKPRNAVSHVLDELSRTRRSVARDLIEEQYVSAKEIVEVPFGLGLLINKISKKSPPSELIDAILEERNSRANRNFRSWLERFDQAIRGDNLEEKQKFRATLKRAADELTIATPEQKPIRQIIQNLSNFGKEMLGIGISIMLGKPPINEGFGVLSKVVDFIYLKVSFPYVAYIQNLGKAGFDIATTSRLEETFGRQGREFASILRYYSTMADKADAIIKVQRDL